MSNNAADNQCQPIVERLRREGADAFSQKYSLGMFKLCAEAADRIEELEAALRPFAEYQLRFVGFTYGVSKDDIRNSDWAAGFDGPQPEFRHFEAARAALSPSTPEVTG